MKNFLKTFFWIFWIILLLIWHIGIYVGIKEGETSSIRIGIELLVIWWALTLGVAKIKSRKKEKQVKKYNEQYVSNIEIHDERFGNIIIVHDSFKHEYKGLIKKVNFDRQLLDVDIWCDDNLNLEKMIENLKLFCDNAVQMKRRIYPELTDNLKNGDHFDENGNSIEITEQFLREKFRFSSISLSSEETVELEGSWEDSGSQDYSISYNIANDKFEYRLL